MQKRRNTAIAERGSLIWGGVQRIKKEKYGHCGKGVADLVWGAKKGEKRSLRLLLEKRVAILGWGAKKGKISVSVHFHNCIYKYFVIFLMKFVILY